MLVQLIISVALIALILLQVKGQGFSPTFSSDSSVFRTRRGVEKTLFQLTIVVAIIYAVLSIIAVLAARG